MFASLKGKQGWVNFHFSLEHGQAAGCALKMVEEKESQHIPIPPQFLSSQLLKFPGLLCAGEWVGAGRYF